MRSFRFGLRAILATSLVLLTCPLLMADTVQQLNLAEMVKRADKIYRGTVLSQKESTIDAGGTQLPVVTYRLRVEEVFLGDFESVKGVQIAEIRMLGKMKDVRQGQLQLNRVLPKMPQLAIGQTYLVMTTRASAIGLSTTVGLGQGAFRISPVGKEETATNEINNNGLFRDMSRTVPGARTAVAVDNGESRGPIKYKELARQIREQVGKKKEK